MWLRQWYKDEEISPEMETQVWPFEIKSFASGLGSAPPSPLDHPTPHFLQQPLQVSLLRTEFKAARESESPLAFNRSFQGSGKPRSEVPTEDHPTPSPEVRSGTWRG